MAKVSAVHLNLLQLLNNTNVKVNEQLIYKDMLGSVLRGEFYLGGLICAMVMINGVEGR